MQQCATLGSARLSLLVWNDSACPTTARELPQRTPAIVPPQESERSGIDGRGSCYPRIPGSQPPATRCLCEAGSRAGLPAISTVACCCSTPEAVTSSSWPLRTTSGSGLDEEPAGSLRPKE